MGYDHVSNLYMRCKKVLHAAEQGRPIEDAVLNGMLTLLVKNKEHIVTIAEKLKLDLKEVRDRVTLDEVGLVACEPSDLRRTAEYVRESLGGDTTAKNLAAAPLLRTSHLLQKMAEEYEKSTAAQAAMIERKRAQHG